MTNTPSLRLIVHPGDYAVCQLPGDPPTLPDTSDRLTAVLRTPAETTLVCPLDHAPDGATVERHWHWRWVEIGGPLAFGQIGILASVATPLAGVSVPIFVLSTYDTDHLLIPAAHLETAIATLTAAGHRIVRTDGEGG